MPKFESVYPEMMPTLRTSLLVLVISASLGMLLFSYLHFSETSFFPVLTATVSGFVCSALIGAVAGAALFMVNSLLDHWLPWSHSYTYRFIAGYIASFALAIAVFFGLASLLINLFGPYIFWLGFDVSDQDLKVKSAILLSSTVFIYTVVYALLYSYQQYAVAQIESLQRERKQLELQFEALKSQLSPHYLFNSLNTISSLIYKDTPSAEQFIRRLAQTYQYILATQHKRYVTLKEEVDFVQSYYYLLRIRFQQHLQVEINLPSTIMNSRIPPLTLQILVENAVKHNRITSEQKLFIYISAQDNTYLRIINTKTEHLGNVQSFRLGLENIRRRYEFFTQKKIEIHDEDKFSVMLPVIPPLEREQEYKHAVAV